MKLLAKWFPNLNIDLVKLSQSSATKGQDIRWGGTVWVPSGPVIQTVTATGNIANDEQDVILVNAAGAVTLTLNFTAASRVRPLHIKKIGSGNVTIVSAGSDTFDGNASVQLRGRDAVTLIPSGGSFWLF